MNEGPFCETATRPAIAESILAFAFADVYPVSPGRELVAPRLQVDTCFGCTREGNAALWALVDGICEMLTAARRPAGFNVGSTPADRPGR